MFPKSNMDEPFPYTSSQEFLKRPFAYDHHHHHNQNPNPNSTVVEDHPFFLNFPSPFLDVHGFPLSQIFSQHHHQEPDTNNYHGDESDLGKAKDNPSAADISRIGLARLKKIMEDQSSSKKISAEPEATSSRKGKVSTKPRRRTGKKDRHSKICTAQGVRDRRMRLSLQIARKFFDLQDMLGFDKASKTIEWLFSKSKNAIKELSAQNTPQESNNNSNDMSECDNEIEEDNNDFVDHPEKEHTRKLSKMESSRDRAGTRARAREKTKEKMAIKRANKGKELYATINPNSNPTQEIRRYTQFGIMESYLGGSSSSVTSIFDYNGGGGHNNIVDSDNCFMEFLENWDTIKSTTNSNCNNRSTSTMITDEVQNIIPGNSSSIYLDNPSS